MIVKSALENILQQLSWLLANTSNDEYSQTAVHLNGASIGQHVRHTLEFLKCLFDGISTGEVNYDSRKRDIFLESNTLQAQALIDQLQTQLDQRLENANLTLIQTYGDSEPICVASNLDRELIYNIEHAVHHMALIRIGLKEVKPNLVLEESFGLADSTLRYRKSKEALNSSV